MDPCAAAVWPYFKLLRKAKFYFFAATLFAGHTNCQLLQRPVYKGRLRCLTRLDFFAVLYTYIFIRIHCSSKTRNKKTRKKDTTLQRVRCMLTMNNGSANVNMCAYYSYYSYYLLVFIHAFIYYIYIIYYILHFKSPAIVSAKR